MLQFKRAVLFLQCTKDELERRSKREERDKKILKFSLVLWLDLCCSDTLSMFIVR
jgi:hypothetical protein